MQVAWDTLVPLVPYLPVPSQAVVPADAWYWPAGQALQASGAEVPPILVPSWPDGQSVQLVDLAPEMYLPVGQSVQAVAVDAREVYLPPTQPVQAVPPELYVPAGQSSEHSEDPAMESLPLRVREARTRMPPLAL